MTIMNEMTFNSSTAAAAGFYPSFSTPSPSLDETKEFLYAYEIHFRCSTEKYLSQQSHQVGDMVIVHCDRGYNIGFVHRELNSQELFTLSNAQFKPKKILASLPPHDEKICEMLISKINAENYALEECRAHCQGRRIGALSDILGAEFQFDRKKLTIFMKLYENVSVCRLVRKLYDTFKIRVKVLEVDSADVMEYRAKRYLELSKLNVPIIALFDRSVLVPKPLPLDSFPPPQQQQQQSQQQQPQLAQVHAHASPAIVTTHAAPPSYGHSYGRGPAQSQAHAHPQPHNHFQLHASNQQNKQTQSNTNQRKKKNSPQSSPPLYPAIYEPYHQQYSSYSTSAHQLQHQHQRYLQEHDTFQTSRYQQFAVPHQHQVYAQALPPAPVPAPAHLSARRGYQNEYSSFPVYRSGSPHGNYLPPPVLMPNTASSQRHVIYHSDYESTHDDSSSHSYASSPDSIFHENGQSRDYEDNRHGAQSHALPIRGLPVTSHIAAPLPQYRYEEEKKYYYEQRYSDLTTPSASSGDGDLDDDQVDTIQSLIASLTLPKLNNRLDSLNQDSHF